MLAHLRDYIALTKPRIISLLLVTTVATMVVAAPEGLALSTVLWTMLGGYLAAGGAGAINHYLDRERDARMARTRARPIVAGKIEPLHGLAFGIALGVLAFVQLALTVNPLAASLAMAGLLGYVFVYTMWLKPLTPQNIVIGGAAGAVPPLVGWAAATGGPRPRRALPVRDRLPLDPAPLLGALAADQGRLRAHRGPMLPVVRGEEATRRQIVVYAAVLAPFTLAPVATGLLGGIYLVAALVLGVGFLGLAIRLCALAVPCRGTPPLPLLARLPGAALHRDGRRSDHASRLNNGGVPLRPSDSPRYRVRTNGPTARREEPPHRAHRGLDRGRRLRARIRLRDLLHQLMSEPAPEPTELIYVPEPSWMPALAAVGLLGVLAGSSCGGPTA